MISAELITSKILEGFRDLGYFIVEVVINHKKQITVLIDTENGITINECVGISRFLSQTFGNELDEYDVQVSSPGLDKGFKVIEQYRKNLGKGIDIVKTDGMKVVGKLIIVEKDFVEVEEEIKLKPKKNKEVRCVKIEFSEIKIAKAVIKIN